MAKHRADESGMERAADNWAENMADQVPDGVDNGPRDTANEGPDPRTEVHSSLSEGSNAGDNRSGPGEDIDPDDDKAQLP
jgi:hypothetical protein